MLLPTFTPHHNFDWSKCAYLGADASSKDHVRILVDFEPIMADPGVIDIYTMAGDALNGTCIILDKKEIR